MLIDRYFPQVVAKRSTLPAELHREGASRSHSAPDVDAMIALVPEALRNAGCFLDGMTGLWRYEFGKPAHVAGRDFVGTHIWIEVWKLYSVLESARARLRGTNQASYLRRLADPMKHLDALVEFVPTMRVPSGVSAEYEVPTGSGGRSADWLYVDTAGKRVLLDVKRRTSDMYQYAEALMAQGEATTDSGPAPAHDPQVLFRSIEPKFMPSSPSSQLQGAWVITDLAQPRANLRSAFEALDESKVHFVVLNNWGAEAVVLARRTRDADYLTELFALSGSGRFEFDHDDGA